MRQILIISICLIIQSNITAQAYQFRGTDRNGIYPDTGLLDHWPEGGPELIATIGDIGDGYGSPSINQQGIFIAGMLDSSGYIFHFNHQHQLQWRTPYGREFTFKYTGARGTPTLEENRLYYSGSHGDAFCLNTRTGEFIWKKNIFDLYNNKTSKWGYTESPLIYRDLVILTPGGPGNNVVALDKMTGKEIWNLDLDSAVNAYNSPILINHRGEDLIMLNTSKQLLLIEPLQGTIRYSHPIEHPNDMHAISGIYRDGLIFHTTGYGAGSVLLKLNETSRGMDTVYFNPDLDCRLSGLIPFDGVVYGASDRKKQWVGIDLETGKTLFTTRKLKPGSFLLADNKFFIFTEMGELALAIPGKEGFKVVSRLHIPVNPAPLAFAHPMLYKGILYVRYREHLWLYNVSSL